MVEVWLSVLVMMGMEWIILVVGTLLFAFALQ